MTGSENYMSASVFLQSYDRDCLEMWHDPMEVVNEFVLEVKSKWPGMSIWSSGQEQWPVCLMKELAGITGEPLWPQLQEPPTQLDVASKS